MSEGVTMEFGALLGYWLVITTSIFDNQLTAVFYWVTDELPEESNVTNE